MLRLKRYLIPLRAREGRNQDSTKTCVSGQKSCYQSPGNNITTPIRVSDIVSVAAVHPAPVVSKVLPPSVWWICFTSLRFISSGIPVEANKKITEWWIHHLTMILLERLSTQIVDTIVFNFFVSHSLCVSPNSKRWIWHIFLHFLNWNV